MVRSGLGFAFMPEYAVNDPGVVAPGHWWSASSSGRSTSSPCAGGPGFTGGRRAGTRGDAHEVARRAGGRHEGAPQPEPA